MPKISVICGAYNNGSYYSFEKSMESILSQTFADFEFIICNDASSDNTLARLLEYAERDSRIRIIENEQNLGLAASLNRCLEVSGGEFIARHDLDDYSAPDRFEKQLEFFGEHPEISVLGTACRLFDESGVWGEESYPEYLTDRDFLFCSPYKHGSVMMRREALLSVGGYRVAKQTRRTEDYDLFMTLQASFKGANLKEPLYDFCEDKQTLARRKYKYRIDEAKIRYRGFKKLGLLPRGILYVIKPLIVGLIPARLLLKIKNKSLKNRVISTDDDSRERID